MPLEQLPAVVQFGSPPPVTSAVLVTSDPTTLAVGVTGMMKLVLAFTASPAGTVHVTFWPEAVQPDGIAPSVNPAGMASLTVACAVVAAVPLLLTFSV